MDDVERPELRFLHGKDKLVPSKLELFAKIETEKLLASLTPGNEGSLKTRLDGTVIDGHHRLHVLKDRGWDIDALPREVIPKQEL